MPARRLSDRYADASRDELLDLLEHLLREQEAWASQIAALQVEISIQRLSGWNRGFEWGWRSCLRDLNGKNK
jgi:hypothetical protein